MDQQCRTFRRLWGLMLKAMIRYMTVHSLFLVLDHDIAGENNIRLNSSLFLDVQLIKLGRS